MTVQGRNEAAERLRDRLRMRAADPCDEGCHEDDQYIVGHGLDEALAGERRVTVERIKWLMPSERHDHAANQDEEFGFNTALHDLLAILDEEAAR